MSIKVLYILGVVGTILVLWAAVAAFWRVRRHMRASSDHGLREIQGEQKASKESR